MASQSRWHISLSVSCKYCYGNCFLYLEKNVIVVSIIICLFRKSLGIEDPRVSVRLSFCQKTKLDGQRRQALQMLETPPPVLCKSFHPPSIHSRQQSNPVVPLAFTFILISISPSAYYISLPLLFCLCNPSFVRQPSLPHSPGPDCILPSPKTAHFVPVTIAASTRTWSWSISPSIRSPARWIRHRAPRPDPERRERLGCR